MTAKSSDEVAIHFIKYGDQRDLIVFVHGWSCDQSYWREQVDYFKDKYQLVTIDLAGHGKSTVGSRKDWTIANLAHDVTNVIKGLSYDQVTLVGHSLGSMVVIEVATHLDKSKTKLVAVDYLKTPLQPLPETVVEGFLYGFRSDFQQSARGFVTTLFRPDSINVLRDSIMNYMSSAPKEVAIPLMKDLVIQDFGPSFKILEEYNIPRYIVNSDLAPIDEAHYKGMGFEMEVIPETGHFLMMEKPLKFNQLIEKYL